MLRILRYVSCFIVVFYFYLTPICAQGLPKIQCLPSARWGLFREANTISIQTTNNVPIQITDLDGAVVYQGAPTSLTLTRGHYFVASSDDVAEFAVLPNDYAGSSFFGMEQPGLGIGTNVFGAFNPSWVRMGSGAGALWSDVQPQAGVWDWSTADQVISNNVGSGRKLIWQAFFRPSWLTDDNQFISLYSNYVSRVVQRYGVAALCHRNLERGRAPFALSGVAFPTSTALINA